MKIDKVREERTKNGKKGLTDPKPGALGVDLCQFSPLLVGLGLGKSRGVGLFILFGKLAASRLAVVVPMPDTERSEISCPSFIGTCGLSLAEILGGVSE